MEEEFIFNIVDIICSLLLDKDAQEEFKNLHGIKHMLNIMRDNNLYRILAVKLLNFATLNNETNCSELIELEGLKSVFSYFMGKGLKGKKNKDTIESIEEHILSLISSLFKFSKSVQYDRLIYKFKENNHEKCERIIEFYKKYDDLLKAEEDEERRAKRESGGDQDIGRAAIHLEDLLEVEERVELPGVPDHRRPCLRLGLSWSHGVGAHAELCRDRKSVV